MYFKPGGYETDHLLNDLSVQQLLSHMGVPMKYVGDALAVDLPAEVSKWLENLPFIFRPSYENLSRHLCGMGLIFYGEPGTRKTTTAAATLLAAIQTRTPNTDPTGHNFTWHGAAMGRFVDWQEASEVFRSANSGDEDEAMIANEIRTAMIPSGPMLNRADFLVLDDISRERPTEYNTTELQRILRRRGDNGYPTILTTNTQPEFWPAAHGEALAGYLSRAFTPVEFE